MRGLPATRLTQLYPNSWNISIKFSGKNVAIHILESEVDDLWSFVGNKGNKQWVWLAIDRETRQIIAFHVGDRSKNSAKQLWEKIPEVYRNKAVFYHLVKTLSLKSVPEFAMLGTLCCVDGSLFPVIRSQEFGYN